MIDSERKQQLNVIVRNLGPKTERKNYAYLDNQLPNKVRWLSNNPGSKNKIVSSFLFTIEEIESHLAKLQNKPSWDDAPKGAKILVYCPDIKGWIFGSFPSAVAIGHGWRGISSGKWFRSETIKGEVIGDWRDTLEKWPDQITYSNEDNDQPASEEEEAFKVTEEQQNNNADWYKKTLPPVGTKCIFTKDNAICYIVAHHMCGERAIWGRHPKTGALRCGRKQDFEPITDKTLWCDEVTQRTGLHFERESLEAIYNAGLGVLPK